jgi:hypothetical protein
MPSLPTLLLLTIASTAGSQDFAVQIEAAGPWESAPPGLSVMQCGGVTLGQAVEQVRRQYNGRIVSAVTQVSGDCETHVIKVLLADGKVKTVRVPGKRRG